MKATIRHTFRCALACCMLFFLTVTAKSQQRQHVTGTIKNRHGQPLPQVAILLKNPSGEVIGFQYTNADGKYQLYVPDSGRLNNQLLEINWLGYKKVQRTLETGLTSYDFVLEETVTELKEVTIKTKPVIRQNGDTLSYTVSNFAQKEDRSIGDVIKRLPGMTVDEDGKIYFNGKITSLYIHNDDLMDGRYGLATKVINKDLIKSVEVIQNHQPIRVLQNKFFSDNVAVNLVLKDENSLKLSGQAIAGLGLPGQYEGELNVMLFNKRFKTLNSTKANNTGADYQGEFQQVSQPTVMNTVEDTKPNALLSEGITGNPDLPRRNYYRNRSAVLNINHLYNTRDTLQLRSNIQLFLDRNRLDYRSQAVYYLPTDTAYYNSQQEAYRKPFTVNASLTATKNKTAYFLNEHVHFNYSGYNNSSYLRMNGEGFQQGIGARTYDFSNDLQYTPALKGKNVANIRWLFSYYNAPQTLNILSGIDSGILNAGKPYAALRQQAGTPSLNSNLSAFYSVQRKALIRQTYQAGLINERQQLHSSLLLTQLSGTMTPYAGDAGNALRWRRDKLYIAAAYYAEKPYWRVDLSVPVSWQRIQFSQEEYGLDEERRQVLVNPALHIRWYVNPQDYITAKYQYTNTMGSSANLYRGLIVSNYLTLSANDAGLQEKGSSTVSLQYNYQRNLVPLFMNAGISFNRTTANAIMASVFTNSIRRMVLLPYANSQSTISADAGVSTYFFAIKANASITGSWRNARYNQLINGNLFPYLNDYFSVSGSIQSKLIDRIPVNYTATASWNSGRSAVSKSLPETTSRFRRTDQQLMIGYSHRSRWLVNVTGRQVYGIQTGMEKISYCFLDANLRYKSKRADFELSLINLLNVEEYRMAQLTANQLLWSSYVIRERMAVLRVTFNL